MNGSCLKQDKIICAYEIIVNILFKIYCLINTFLEIKKKNHIRSNLKVENWSFAAVSLTKTFDIDEYKYSGYDTGFDRKEKFSIAMEFDRNCIIFGVYMGPSVHIDKKKKSNLIFREGLMQRLDDTMLTAEKSV